MIDTARSKILATAAALILATAPLSAEDRIHPGQWEFTTTRPGADPNIFKHCITAAEAGSVNGDTKSARAYAEKAAGTRCKVTDYKVEGRSVSYALLCGDTSIRSTTIFQGDTSEGDLYTRHAGGAEVVSHVKARRLGDCP